MPDSYEPFSNIGRTIRSVSPLVAGMIGGMHMPSTDFYGAAQGQADNYAARSPHLYNPEFSQERIGDTLQSIYGSLSEHVDPEAHRRAASILANPQIQSFGRMIGMGNLVDQVYDVIQGGQNPYRLGQGVLQGHRGVLNPQGTAYGLSASEAGDLAGQMFGNLFSEPHSLESTHGFTSKDIGSLYGALGQSGRLGTGGPTSTEQYAREMSERIKGYTELLSNLQTMFPEAEIEELYRAADSFTGQAASQYKLKDLARLLGQTSSGMQMQGMGAEDMTAMFGASQNSLRQLGLNPALAVGGVQAATGLRGALQSGLYGGMEGTAGLDSIDQLAYRNMERANRFIGSQAGKRMSMIADMAQHDPGMANVLQQLQSGQDNSLLHMSDQAFAEAIAGQTGFDAGMIQDTLRNSDMLMGFYQNALARGDITQGMVAGAQQSDLARNFSPVLASQMAMLAKRSGVDLSMQDLGGLSDKMTQSLFGMDPTQWKDQDAVAQNILSVMQSDPQMAKVLQGMSPQQQRYVALNLAESPMQQFRNLGMMSLDEGTADLMASFSDRAISESGNFLDSAEAYRTATGNMGQSGNAAIDGVNAMNQAPRGQGITRGLLRGARLMPIDQIEEHRQKVQRMMEERGVQGTTGGDRILNTLDRNLQEGQASPTSSRQPVQNLVVNVNGQPLVEGATGEVQFSGGELGSVPTVGG